MKKNYTDLFLRIGLAFVFIYAGIGAFVNPESWIGFIPSFLGEYDSIVLSMHIVFNLLLGLWLLSGKWRFYSASVSAVALFVITIFNFSFQGCWINPGCYCPRI